MPYTPPPTWQHGEYPTAAKLNLYKDALDAIHDHVGDVRVQRSMIHVTGKLHSHWFINQHRYLHYVGEGSIHDPNNQLDTVSLTGSGSTWQTYDLTSIEWIVIGKLYEVQGVTEAYEDYA